VRICEARDGEDVAGKILLAFSDQFAKSSTQFFKFFRDKTNVFNVYLD